MAAGGVDGSGGGAAPSEEASMAAAAAASTAPEWVELELKLQNWAFAGTEARLQCRVSTPLYLIKQRLVERHGRMASLTIFREASEGQGASGAVEVPDDRVTLADLGIRGAVPTDSRKKGLPRATLWYDFKPYAHDEPVLLAEHRIGEK